MKNKVFVLNSANLDIGDFNDSVLETILNAKFIFVNGQSEKLIKTFKDKNIEFLQYDNLYEDHEYIEALVKSAIEKLEKNDIAILSRERFFDEFIYRLSKLDIKFVNIRGFGICDNIKNDFFLNKSVRILKADSVKKQSFQHNCIIYGINNVDIAKNVKEMLSYSCDADLYVNVINLTSKNSIKLSKLDALDEYHDYTSLVVEENIVDNRYFMDDLLDLMRYLRSENGCPWDREQTHESLRKYLIEEVYEAAVAIDGGNKAEMVDEFGDVLLQLALHSVIDEEEKGFNFNDISTSIYKKMYSRHRHIFGNDVCKTADEVSDNWQKIKKEEKKLECLSDELDDVNKGLPELLRAEKIQKKVSKVGYEFENVNEAIDKVIEEANEFKIELENHGNSLMEFGDLLFSCVNVSRLIGVDPAKALNLSTEKFIKRIKCIENKALSEGKSLKSLTKQEKSVYWCSSKVDEA